MRVKAPVATESQEQKALFQWVHLEATRRPDLRLCFAIPNGGLRNVITARRMKAEGVRPGVPDICLPVARGGYHGLWIELKRIKGGRLSDSQEDWITALNRQKYWAVTCLGWKHAAEVIKGYLELPK